MPDTDWTAVTEFFNRVIEEASNPQCPTPDDCLGVLVYSKELNQSMVVKIPARNVEDFMKNLPLFQAEMYWGQPMEFG